jgi:hypothetical protein
VLCAHGGQAAPAAPSRRVMVSGQPIATIAAPYSITKCNFVPPTGNGPCVTAQWLVGALRVMSEAQPVVIMSGIATCAPTGTPLFPVIAQTRVIAT